MIFDKLCSIAEKTPPEKNMFETLSKTRLFHFDTELTKDVLDSELPGGTGSFFLPFRHTAIEDNSTCIVFSDTEKKQVGMSGARSFMLLTDMNRLIKHLGLKDLPGLYAYSQGTFKNIKSKMLGNRLKWTLSHEIKSSMYVDKSGFSESLSEALLGPEEHKAGLIKAIVETILVPVISLAAVNLPTNFILETSDTKKKKTSKKRLLRAHQRPSYTILTPAKIRKKMRLPDTSSSIGKHSKGPHERRSHIRYLSHEFYSKKGEKKKKYIDHGPRKGQAYYKKIIVKSTWIGPNEAVRGTRRYKVLIDR